MQYVIIGVIIFIVLFLILREVNNWYWKINERISLQNETNEHLKKLTKAIEELNSKYTNYQ
jgi:hypothetical protein